MEGLLVTWLTGLRPIVALLLTGGFMNTLIDSCLVDERYALANISKAFYLVLSQQVGKDESILVCADLSLNELASIKAGLASIELMSRTCDNLFIQFIHAYSDSGLQVRVRTARLTFRLTP